MAKNDRNEARELDTTGIKEPKFSPDEAQEKMRRILEGSRKGGAKTREMIRFAKEKMGGTENWQREAGVANPEQE
jgi:uncharacterized sporulation protein YeaH/YhbH (DUF444 family)